MQLSLAEILVLAVVQGVAEFLPVSSSGHIVVLSHWIAGAMFPVTGAALLFLSYKPAGNVEYPQMTLRQAIWIGISQAVAILPGLSRSGSTIATGVGVGLTRSSAAAFSFLMAIPVIAGAGLLEAIDFWQEGKLSTPISHMLLGAAVSFIVGLGALWCLNRWLERGRLQIFAWYCILLGIAVLAWQSWELYRV